MVRKDVKFILLHEIYHVFLKHHIRGPIRMVNFKKLVDAYMRSKKRTGKTNTFLEKDMQEAKHILKEWNYATDYIINDSCANVVNIPIMCEFVYINSFKYM